ncbi:FxSxx-COOH system tetratricopeptide repeat protein [Actinomadura sp. B10D3]|uniref:FxSxx-COOH system tetratricopeptide repeat protein n=1 Tax=Actinomadura sp. B10D3 TaxID=3153557 RepID=UPI00325D321A
MPDRSSDSGRRQNAEAALVTGRQANGARSAPPQVWGRVPQRNKNFTGREKLLADLREAITDRVAAVLPHALHGLGGVGKTQMAVEYAHRFRDDYDLVWWISADQPVLVRSALAALAPHLGLPPATATGVEEASTAALDALRRGDPYSRWLLIFDNADDPEEIKDTIPEGPGDVLITSRNHRWKGVVAALPVDVFAREESIAFLERRVPRSIDGEEADRLAEELGDLPLALEQAAALQAETGMTVDEYLRLLKNRTSQLLGEGKPTEYPVSMTAAWDLSVSSLSSRMPEAVELLRCCAFFGPEPIPREVFGRRVDGLRPELGELLDDPIRLSRAVGELGRYALARIDPVSRTIQVHRLIQALVRDELDQAEKPRFRADVHRLLIGLRLSSPEESINWDRYGDCFAHVVPSRVPESKDPEVRAFALDMARYLYVSSAGFAVDYVQLLIDRWERDSGPEDVDVLRAYRELGNVLRQLGRYNEVFELNQTTLGRMRAAGLTEPDVLLLVNSIGADLRARGDFAAALRHDSDSLRQHEAAFGPDDPRTLRAIHNLALDYSLTSDFVRAREGHLRGFVGQRDAPGDVGAAFIVAGWNSLARAVRLGGDYAEACDLGQDALAYGVDYLGVEHPVTLHTAKDLSIALRRTGEVTQALEMCVDVHARYVRRYGLNHPDTLAAAMSLANVQRNSGQEEKGLELAADTVKRYPRIYGPNHPYLHACTGNLAVLHRVCGDPATARNLNEETMRHLAELVGPDHHYCLTVATNLASDMAALGDFDGAVRLGRGTYERVRNVLGVDHPMTLACVGNLATDLGRLGTDEAREEADRLREDTTERYARKLTLDHPDSLVFLDGRHLDCDFDPPPI